MFLDLIELHVIIDVGESFLGVLQILIGYDLVLPVAVFQGLGHELSVLSPHHDQSVVDSFLAGGDLLSVKLFIFLFFDLGVLERLDFSQGKLVTDGQGWSCAGVLEKADRVVVLTQVIADMQTGHRTPGEVAKGHTWVVYLMH